MVLHSVLSRIVNIILDTNLPSLLQADIHTAAAIHRPDYQSQTHNPLLQLVRLILNPGDVSPPSVCRVMARYPPTLWFITHLWLPLTKAFLNPQGNTHITPVVMGTSPSPRWS